MISRISNVNQLNAYSCNAIKKKLYKLYLQERRLYTKKHSFFTCVILQFPKRRRHSTFLRIYKWEVLIKMPPIRNEEIQIKKGILQKVTRKVRKSQKMITSSKWICSINIVFIVLSRLIFIIRYL